MGRPSKYSKKLANAICALLAEGMSLRSICARDGMPDKSTVLRWAMDPTHDFHDRYERARELYVHSLVDEMQDIADDGSNDYYEKTGRDGSSYLAVDHDNINRSKLRIQHREWLAERVLRRMYGNKVDHKVSAPDGGPVQFCWVSGEENEVPEGEAGNAHSQG